MSADSSEAASEASGARSAPAEPRDVYYKQSRACVSRPLLERRGSARTALRCDCHGSYPTKQREEQRNIEGKKKEVQETKNFVSIQGRALLGGYGWVLFSWALTRDLKKPSFPLPAKNIRKQALSKVPQKGGMGDPNQSQRMGSDHTLQNKGRSKEILRGRKKKYRKPKISFRFKVELCWTPNKVVIKKERV